MTALLHKKDGVSRFFLILSLLVSVFTFTGYTGHASPAGTRADQTELLARSKPKDRKAVSFQTALAGMAQAGPRVAGNDRGFCALTLLHNRLTAIKFVQSLRVRASFRRAAGYLPLRTIPRAEDEDFVPAS